MNILEKLRRLSTANKFIVKLTRSAVEELLQYYPDYAKRDSEDMKNDIADLLQNLNGEDMEAKSVALTLTFHVCPIQIDYSNQALINCYSVLRAFTLSKHEEIVAVIEFVTVKPITETD